MLKINSESTTFTSKVTSKKLADQKIARLLKYKFEPCANVGKEYFEPCGTNVGKEYYGKVEHPVVSLGEKANEAINFLTKKATNK
ncbi:MAG: hypothetical protein E7Z89_05840 [Cyanobacteria bacterium SIG28]|nr:hypothetical protein [Cyanobacteria bacterium SIG28]